MFMLKFGKNYVVKCYVVVWQHHIIVHKLWNTTFYHHLQELVTGLFHKPEQSNPHVLLVQMKDIWK